MFDLAGAVRPAGEGSGAVPAEFEVYAFWLGSPQLAELFDALQTVGEARVVGGAVRNTLLGEPVGDVDVATDAVPEAVARAAREAGFTVHETGLAHGTLTVVVNGRPFEVTTLREDVSTDGRRATVRFTRDFARDAERRDFTLNALYVDRHGRGTDYVGGHADCLARRIRFIGNPEARIREDHLRILRLFRFQATHGTGPLDPEGLAAATRLKDSIAALSAERVAHELLRLVEGARAADVLDVMSEGGFLAPFVPGPLHVAGFRALRAVEGAAGRPATPLLALVALTGFNLALWEEVATNLRLSRRQRMRGSLALEAARAMPPRSVPHVRALLYEHGPEPFSDGLLLAVANGADVIDLPHLLGEARRWTRPRFPVGGDDLLEQGGSGGPELGERLRRLEQLWQASDFSLDRSALLALDRDQLVRRH